ncbi:MAG TPA: class I SAM-dependent methyltransferase [Polyangiaceae bacterium]|jgi:SAM-dependent methyltransferase|nr:class I SAM-dependent methyltransferase [Polyangiaceae bacterium]
MVNELQKVVDRFLAAQISAPVAAMELLLACPNVERVARTLPQLSGEPAEIRKLSALFSEHVEGCSTISVLLKSGLDSPEPATTVEDGLARVRRLFDYSVLHSEEASVALYSLGDSEMLAAATAEAVRVFESWGVLGPARDALEIGCGIGRFLVALSPKLATLVGIDVSRNMIEAARRRTQKLDNAHATLATGRDLSQFGDSSFDLVFSVDAFPYLVQSGRSLVETHFREVARVLRPGGDFVIFNYAYGRSREQDKAEVTQLAVSAGYSVERLDETPFRIWNGIGFHLRKPTDELQGLGRCAQPDRGPPALQALGCPQRSMRREPR